MKAKKTLVFLFITFLLTSAGMPGLAKDARKMEDRITPMTVVGGALSLLVWPGIGQAINDNKFSKVATHAIVFGLLPPGRFWSCYDAVVDRKGGYWKGRI